MSSNNRNARKDRIRFQQSRFLAVSAVFPVAFATGCRNAVAPLPPTSPAQSAVANQVAAAPSLSLAVPGANFDSAQNKGSSFTVTSGSTNYSAKVSGVNIASGSTAKLTLKQLGGTY